MARFKKRTVSKFKFLLLNFIFHSICLAGLIWQITQISINFFEYDVLKDINVIMPEEIWKFERVLYVCFKNEEIIPDNVYISAVKKDKGEQYEYQEKKSRKKYIHELKIGKRFEMTPDSNDIFMSKEPEVYAKNFIMGFRYCYQINLTTDEKPIISRAVADKISEVSILLGQELPHFDYRRLMKIVSNVWKTRNGSLIAVSSFWYHIIKLKYPYKDNCVDYTELKYDSRLDATAICISIVYPMMNGNVSNIKIITKDDRKYFNKQVIKAPKPFQEKCAPLFKSDCVQRVYITHTGPTVDWEGDSISFDVDEDDDPSFVIKSKPRIDNIDFVTYIFGALGAWIGFSFIAINPIPFLFTQRGCEVRDIDTDNGYCRKFLIINRNMRQVQKIVTIMKNDIRESLIQSTKIDQDNIKIRKDIDDNKIETRKILSRLLNEFRISKLTRKDFHHQVAS